MENSLYWCMFFLMENSFSLMGKSLQIISLIRLAFDGNVTFVFSYIEIYQVKRIILHTYINSIKTPKKAWLIEVAQKNCIN